MEKSCNMIRGLKLMESPDAKRITDKVINMMEGVQNLRKAVYE